MLHKTPRTFLFVPATRPDRFGKAFASGSDAILIDWEDSVTDEQRDVARQNTKAFDKACDPEQTYWLRINSATDPAFKEDLAAAATLTRVAGVFLPKVEDCAEITKVYDALKLPVIAMIESAAALVRLPSIASVSGLYTLTYGRLDFANDLGCDVNHPTSEVIFDRLRAELLIQARANRLHQPVESIYPDFRDDDGLREYIGRWRAIGFGSMLCIHPRQVAVVNDACQPTEAEVAFARRILEEYERLGVAAFQLDGEMIDTPVIKRARALLAGIDEE